MKYESVTALSHNNYVFCMLSICMLLNGHIYICFTMYIFDKFYKQLKKIKCELECIVCIVNDSPVVFVSSPHHENMSV